MSVNRVGIFLKDFFLALEIADHYGDVWSVGSQSSVFGGHQLLGEIVEIEISKIAHFLSLFGNKVWRKLNFNNENSSSNQ